jgi:CheY-like chemotaxis protein
MVEAARPSEALLKLDGIGRLDALVTDVVMPEMTGLDLAARVWERREGLPVVLMSGYSGSRERPRDRASRIVYLEKPFSPEDLINRLSELLAVS